MIDEWNIYSFTAHHPDAIILAHKDHVAMLIHKKDISEYYDYKCPTCGELAPDRINFLCKLLSL